MTNKELMQMALNELEDRNSDRFYETTKKVCEILEAKLAQPEPDQDGFVFIEARWGKDFFEIQVPDCIGEIVRIYHKQWRGESQPEPDPVAWGILNTRPTEKQLLMMVMLDEPEPSHLVVPLYTAPPQHESTCAECDKKQSDGWALYCVNCLREFYKHDPTNKREWVNLTVEERETLRDAYQDSFSGLISAVQMLLKEKNT